MSISILARTAPTTTAPFALTANLLSGSTEAGVLSSLVVTNTTSLPVVYSVYLISRNGPATPSIENALVFQQTIKKNEVIDLTYGLTLGWGSGTQDVIFVESGTPDALTFTAFGSKVAI